MEEGEGGYFQSSQGGQQRYPQHHQGHVGRPSDPPLSEIPGQVVKIYCEANRNFNLAVRRQEVVLVPADESDPYQQWITDESWSTKVKDSAGFPGFALINRGSGKALRHALEIETPVLLEEYHPKTLNEDVLWTLSGDVGNGWHAVRPVNNIRLNLDADHGLQEYGGVKDGTKVLLFTWKNKENQHWHLTPIKYSHGFPAAHCYPQGYAPFPSAYSYPHGYAQSPAPAYGFSDERRPPPSHDFPHGYASAPALAPAYGFSADHHLPQAPPYGFSADHRPSHVQPYSFDDHHPSPPYGFPHGHAPRDGDEYITPVQPHASGASAAHTQASTWGGSTGYGQPSRPAESPAYGQPSRSGQVVKVFCEADSEFNIAVRDGEVVLVPANDNDARQHWIKDETWSTKVSDAAGYPAFSLINKDNGQALRHAPEPGAQVVLEDYDDSSINEPVLWTLSGDVTDDWYAIRPVNNIHLNLDADHGARKYGGVHDGTKVLLFEWKDGENQRWHIQPIRLAPEEPLEWVY